ncbi:aggregation-promoting factor [Streptococcus dentiloxodontae]
MSNVLESKIKIAKVGLFGLTAVATLGATVVNAETYTVAEGDTLSAIASAHNTTVDALVAENRITDANLILAGQSINITEETAETSNQETATDSSVAVEETVTTETEAVTAESTTETDADSSVTSTTEENVAQETAATSAEETVSEDASVEQSATETEEVTSENETAQDTSASSTAATSVSAETAETTTASYSSSLSAEDAAAKEQIAQHESGGSYTASNGQYYGRYQLTLSYLGGDTSIENQEKTADNYVTSRYGSWSAALAFWNANGWY